MADGALTIGVVSDTHVPRRARRLPPELLRVLREARVDHILHAGDLVDMSVLEQLSAIAPVSAVAGNMDGWDTALQLPRRRIVSLGGVAIGLTHGDEGRGPDTPTRAFSVFADDEVAAVVFGHSHMPFCQWREGRLLFNPGSPTDPRRQPSPTYGLLRIHVGALDADAVAERSQSPRLSGELLRLAP